MNNFLSSAASHCFVYFYVETARLSSNLLRNFNISRAELVIKLIIKWLMLRLQIWTFRTDIYGSFFFFFSQSSRHKHYSLLFICGCNLAASATLVTFQWWYTCRRQSISHPSFWIPPKNISHHYENLTTCKTSARGRAAWSSLCSSSTWCTASSCKSNPVPTKEATTSLWRERQSSSSSSGGGQRYSSSALWGINLRPVFGLHCVQCSLFIPAAPPRTKTKWVLVYRHWF